MLTLIKRLWGSSTKPQPSPVVNPGQNLQRGTGLDVYPGQEDPGDYAITRYPPFDKGIPVIAIDKILHAQQELVDRIFRTAGVSRADFDQLYKPAIVNLARHVHLLPATSTTYFRGTGGLFRMSLEIALNSLQSANAAVFPSGGGVERRFVMQPKWTLATFLAGLCCQNYRTVNSMAVMTRDSAQWTPLLDLLFDWCTRQKTDVYFVRWMEDTHVHGAQASAAYSISQVVPHEVLQYLANDNNQVVPAMTAAIAGVETNTSENPIGRLVAPVITRVIEDDLKRSATNYGHLVIGAHLEMHLVDAMRRLVRGGKWIANNSASGGRLWVGQEGVFIDWPVASGDIANLLARDSFAGIPKDPDTLADLLVSANLLQLNNRGARYWTIALPGTFEAKEGMVKLREGTVIFPQGFDFDPFKNVQLTLTAPGTAVNVPAISLQSAAAPATLQQPAQPKPSQKPPKIAPAAPASPPATESSNAKPFQDLSVEPPDDGYVPPGEERRDQQKKEKPRNRPKAPPQKSDTTPDETLEQSPDAPGPNEESATGLGADISPTAEKLLGSLKRSNAWLLNEVMKAYRNESLRGVVAALPHGLGISHDELNIHGIPVMELLEELGLKAWLWQDKTRASRRIHPVEIDGKTHRMVILKPDIALGLGFDMTIKE
jgi:conjugal transfer pilus assembly protein TraI